MRLQGMGIYRSDVVKQTQPKPSPEPLPPVSGSEPNHQNASGGPRPGHRPR
jgi:hypothetical protein